MSGYFQFHRLDVYAWCMIYQGIPDFNQFSYYISWLTYKPTQMTIKSHNWPAHRHQMTMQYHGWPSIAWVGGVHWNWPFPSKPFTCHVTWLDDAMPWFTNHRGDYAITWWTSHMPWLDDTITWLTYTMTYFDYTMSWVDYRMAWFGYRMAWFHLSGWWCWSGWQCKSTFCFASA